MLEALGHRVTVVDDGLAALNVSGRSAFDLVLMDIQMPVMDGFEAVAAIRARERGTSLRLPIVALTAHAMTGDRERCLAADFDDYLAKPIQATSLRSTLDRVILGSPVIENEPPDLSVHFDRGAALEGLGGDEELLEEVLGLFLEDCPRLLDEIRAAVEAEDRSSLQRLTHTLGGVASNFAANEVVRVARAIENASREGRLAEAKEMIPDLEHVLRSFRWAALGPNDSPCNESERVRADLRIRV